MELSLLTQSTKISYQAIAEFNYFNGGPASWQIVLGEQRD